jgi:hypothetical protein
MAAAVVIGSLNILALPGLVWKKGKYDKLSA